MKKFILNFSFYIFAVFLLFIWIPNEEQKIQKVHTVIMPAKGVNISPVSISDTDGDGIPDTTVQRVPFGSIPSGIFEKKKPTLEEKRYFAEH